MSNNAQTASDARSLLLTRPSESARSFLDALDPQVLAGVIVVQSPLVDITPTSDAPDLEGAGGVILTSANGVALAPDGQERPAFCVGNRTAGFARQRGWHVMLVAETADDLVARIKAPPTPLVHLAGRHRRGDIAERLTERGHETRVHVLYDQQEMDLTEEARHLLEGPTQVIAPVFSPKTAQTLIRQASDLSKVSIIAISEAVAEIFSGANPSEVIVSAAPNGEEMRRSVEKRLGRTTLP